MHTNLLSGTLFGITSWSFIGGYAPKPPFMPAAGSNLCADVPWRLPVIGGRAPKPPNIGLHFFFVSLFWPLFGGQKRMRCSDLPSVSRIYPVLAPINLVLSSDLPSGSALYGVRASLIGGRAPKPP